MSSNLPPQGFGGSPQPAPQYSAPSYAPASGHAPAPQFAGPGYAPAPGHAPAPQLGGQQPPLKSFLATWLLALLLGVLGADRFYLGKIGTGIAKLLTLGGFGIWWLVDLILTLTGSRTDSLRRPLDGFEHHKKIAWIVTAVWIVLGMILGAVNGATAASRVPAALPASSAPALAPAAPAAEPAATVAPQPVEETPAAEPVVETAAPPVEAAQPAPVAPTAAQGPYGAPYPAAQQQFLDRIQQASDEYDAATTDLQRDQVLVTRNADLCGITGGAMQNWVGRITSIGSTGDGNAYVDIEIADNVVVSTWNNEFSDIGDDTLIPADSELFNQLLAMPEASLVEFNGVFEPGSGVCLKTDNLTTIFDVLDPNFVSNFTAIVVK